VFISFLLVSILIGIDQYSKFIVETKFQESFDLIPSLIEIRYSQNTGIAFSLFESYPLFLTILNTIIILGFVIFFVKIHSASFWVNLPALLIIAGGMGNLIDRYLKGYVVDFINPTFINFAIFNLADCFLNIGVFLFILEIIFNAKKRN
jgi:signal peptidase II